MGDVTFGEPLLVGGALGDGCATICSEPSLLAVRLTVEKSAMAQAEERSQAACCQADAGMFGGRAGRSHRQDVLSQHSPVHRLPTC